MKFQDLVSSPPEDSDGRTIMAARPSEDFHGWWVVGWGKGRLKVDEVGVAWIGTSGWWGKFSVLYIR